MIFLVHLLLMFLHVSILYGICIISPNIYCYVDSPVQLSSTINGITFSMIALCRWKQQRAIDFLLQRYIFAASSLGTLCPREISWTFSHSGCPRTLGCTHAAIIIDHATRRTTGNSCKILVNFDPNDVLWER